MFEGMDVERARMCSPLSHLSYSSPKILNLLLLNAPLVASSALLLFCNPTFDHFFCVC